MGDRQRGVAVLPAEPLSAPGNDVTHKSRPGRLEKVVVTVGVGLLVI
jgi:hypothetical protein